jgi:hypothetical protein
MTRLLVGAAIAVAALFGATAQAGAEPIKESTIKSECKAAGGSYMTVGKGKSRISQCAYTDIDGDKWVDDYVGGNYIGTNPI